MLADRVALLENGRVTAIGTHSDLMATVPAYRDLLASKESAEPAASHVAAGSDIQEVQR
jgi:ATP-binding cassette subfamily B protein